MHCRRRDLDPCIYLLVEHLDATLSAGDQLTSLSLEVTEPTARTGPRMLRNREARFVNFVNRARSLEASLIAHILQARRRAAEMPRVRGAARMPIDLFSSVTTVLLDAVAEYGDPAGFAFNSGADRLAYLRSRGVVPADVGSLLPSTTVEITETFLVAGRLQLGTLLDLIETALRTLNTQYELWREGAEEEEELELETVQPMSPLQRSDSIRTLEMGLAEQIALARSSLSPAARLPEPAADMIGPWPASARPPSLSKPPSLPGTGPGSLVQALRDIEQLRPRGG